MALSKLIQFPGVEKADYQPVCATYSVAQIRQLSGVSERLIKRLARLKLITPCEVEGQEPRYDFRALAMFRRLREMRSQGLSLKRVEAELRGQLELFDREPATLSRLLRPFHEALLLDEKGELELAAAAYRRSISEGENLADCHCNLGLIEVERGSRARAADLFTLALRDDPRHLESHYNLANLYADAGSFQPAKLHYEIACEIEPGFVLAYFNLALVNCQLRRFREAFEALERYVEMSPPDEARVSRADELLEWLKRAVSGM